MERVDSKEEVRGALAPVRREARTIGFVPTMGALHEGHLSLVAAARARTDHVVVSIFVNPTQFGPSEDFESYPRDLKSDLDVLGAEGADLVFTPSVAAMYAPDAQVTVDPGPLAARWEGASRPGHFAGVATVVAKLLGVVRPDVAFFGEKDYQQLKVVQRMALDLDLGTEIAACPTVRDCDGIAISSRNVALASAERRAATSLSRGLAAAAAAAAAGESDAEALRRMVAETVEAEPLAALDYAAVVDPETLEPLTALTGPARALVAARAGAVRLIDNVALEPAAGGSGR